MLGDKLISLLKVFSKYELNRFRKFILSPYFNEQEDVVRLFEALNQLLRKGPEAIEAVSKQAVWKTLYPKRSFDDAHLRRLSSDLSQLALRFLVEENRNEDPISEALELQRILEKPGLKKHQNAVERQLQRQIGNIGYSSAETYLLNFQLHLNIFNRSSKVLATSDYMEKLRPVDQHLDSFYISQKLKMYAAALSYSTFRSGGETFALPPGFWEQLEQPLFQSAPIFIVYRRIITCLTESGEESHFQGLVNDLENLGDQLAETDLRECFQIAQNYCAAKINQGKTEYYREIFRIFKNIIQRNVLLTDDQLSEGMFKNIITAGLRVGEFAWAEKFIEEYAGFLPPDIRENARTFNLANLYSHQKQHGKVIELLRNVEYSDLAYAISAKSILVRTYYETDEFMALDSLIDSFRIFLRRNKLISKSLRIECNNFISFVKKLSTLPPANRNAVEKLRLQIERCNSVVSKKWLLEKINEFKS